MVIPNQLNALLLPNGGGFTISEQAIQHLNQNEPANEFDIDLNAELRSIQKQQYQHLANNEITYTDAVNQYGINYTTLRNWCKRGFIKVISSSVPKTLDEEDVAYCAAIFKKRKELGCWIGWPLLDGRGKPNLLKYPDVALYNRKKKKQARLSS